MRVLISAVVAILVALPLAATDNLEVSVSFIPDRQLLGCPVRSEVVFRNTGTKPLVLPPERQLRDIVRFRSEDGTVFPSEGGRPCGPVTWAPLEPGQEKRLVLDEFYSPQICKAGTYNISVEYDETPLKLKGRAPVTVVSEPAVLVFEEPVGIDKEAFQAVLNALKGQGKLGSGCFESMVRDGFVNLALQDRFPTSTYAGYQLGLGPDFPVSLTARPEYVVSELYDRDLFRNYPVASYTTRHPDGKGGWTDIRIRRSMREHILEQRNLIDAFLKVHAEFADREVLELARAYHSLALGDSSEARRSLQWVATKATRIRFRDQAARILELLGKNEDVPSG